MTDKLPTSAEERVELQVESILRHLFCEARYWALLHGSEEDRQRFLGSANIRDAEKLLRDLEEARPCIVELRRQCHACLAVLPRGSMYDTCDNAGCIAAARVERRP